MVLTLRRPNLDWQMPVLLPLPLILRFVKASVGKRESLWYSTYTTDQDVGTISWVVRCPILIFKGALQMMGCIPRSPSPESQSPDDDATAPEHVLQEVRDLRVSPMSELRIERELIRLPLYRLG